MVQIERHTIAFGLTVAFTALSAAFIAGINWSDFVDNQFPFYCGVGSLGFAGGCAIAGAVVYRQYKKSLSFDPPDNSEGQEAQTATQFISAQEKERENRKLKLSEDQRKANAQKIDPEANNAYHARKEERLNERAGEENASKRGVSAKKRVSSGLDLNPDPDAGVIKDSRRSWIPIVRKV